MIAYRGELSCRNLTRKEKESIKKKKIRNRIIKIFLISLVMGFVLYLNPNIIISIRNNIFSGTFTKEGVYKGQVTNLQAEQYVYGQSNEKSKIGVQNIAVEISEGKFQGKVVNIKNNYDNSNPYSYVIENGDRVYLSVEEENGIVKKAYIYDFDRTIYTCIMVGIFIVSFIVIGGKGAIKTLLSLALILPIVLKVLPFFLLRGYNYLIVILLCSLLIISILSFVFQGVTEEAFSTVLGSLGGILVSILFVYVFQYLCKVTGVYYQEMDMILYEGNKVNTTAIIFSGIIIGSIGAIISVSLSIIKKMRDFQLETMNVKNLELFKVGFKEGRESLEKVFSTLTLAYLGAALQTVIIFMVSNNMHILQGINGETIVIEILRIIAGSLGFLCAIPLTVIAYGVFKRKNLEIKKV